MAEVLLELSMSLDGCVAGPDVSSEEPMGHGGEALHGWMFDGRSAAESEQYQNEHFSSIGAVIVGRHIVQEFRLHLAPMVLGAGTRHFNDDTPLKVRLPPVKAATTPLATYPTYEGSGAS
jgi:hypothetical protein